MRVPVLPIPVDWIVTSLRWLILLAFAFSLGVESRLSLPLTLVLLAGALWNLAHLALAALNRRLPAYSYWSVGIDMLVAYALFRLSGGFQGNLSWVGLLPLVSAALYFQVPGALLVSLANLLAQGLLAISAGQLPGAWMALGAVLLLYLSVGGLLGTLSGRLKAASFQKQRLELQDRREAEKAGRERLRAIYRLISALSATLDPQRVLDAALDLSASGLMGPDGQDEGLVSAALLVTPLENGGTELGVGSARRFTSADLQIVPPGGDGLISRAIHDSEPRLTKNPEQDPELGRLAALRPCRAAYCVPLPDGHEVLGVLLFAHPDPEYFTPDRREMLDMIGKQTAISIQNARLYEGLEEEKVRIMEIHEEARKKLARDLHDGPTQSVAALAMRVNYARRLMDRDPKAAEAELYKLEELARRTTKEIRHMLFTLRPLVLESQGLIAALESLAEKMRETYNQNVQIEADSGVISQMEPAKQGVVFYIVDEAVNNARKHAQAAHVWVRLKPAGDELVLLEVQDDGTGFKADERSAGEDTRSRLGLANMQERSELLDGVLKVDSTPGSGTCIRLMIPLSEAAASRLRRGQ